MTDYTAAIGDVTQIDLSATTASSAFPHDTAYLARNERGTVTVVVRRHYGSDDATPEPLWHRRELDWRIAPGTDLDWLREQLAEGGAVAALLDRIAAGHSVNWSGSNYVGELTEDAKWARFELERLLDDAPVSHLEVCDAETWICGDTETAISVLDELGLSGTSTDAEIRVAAEALVDQIDTPKLHVRGGVDAVEDVLRAARDEVRAEAAA